MPNGAQASTEEGEASGGESQEEEEWDSDVAEDDDDDDDDVGDEDDVEDEEEEEEEEVVPPRRPADRLGNSGMANHPDKAVSFHQRTAGTAAPCVAFWLARCPQRLR